MAVIDYESAWYALKAHIQEKRSHGAGELAEAMARFEVENRLEESAGYDDRPPVEIGKRSSSPSPEHAASAA